MIGDFARKKGKFDISFHLDLTFGEFVNCNFMCLVLQREFLLDQHSKHLQTVREQSVNNHTQLWEAFNNTFS